MARQTKSLTRHSENDFFTDDMAGTDGELFELPGGEFWDSRRINILHHGLDTVKQLYSGLIDDEIYLKVQNVYDSDVGGTVEIGGFEWKVVSGRKGGYRYSLQNKHVGLVILLGSFYLEPKYHGHHLKIECSPVFLLSREIEDIQEDLDLFASNFLSQIGHTGVAVHLCADVQGWDCPNDLDSRLTTKARRVVRFTGISELEYDHGQVAMVYGKGETFTFGSVSSIQFSVYDKGKAIDKKGERELWEPVWSQKLDHMFENQLYDPTKQVIRLETRLHHSIVHQFANGSGFTANSLKDLAPHLTGLWQYSLNNFRLDCTKAYIDPFWQFLRDDLKFHHTQKLDIDYKRLYKSPNDDGEPSERSIQICFGQLCSIYGKNGYAPKIAMNYLINSGIWFNLSELYRKRGLEQEDIYIDLVDKLSRFKQAA